jgi:hypothetical protein
MILHKVEVGRYLYIVDADADGLRLVGEHEADESVWLSYEQLDDVYFLVDQLRKINRKDGA